MLHTARGKTVGRVDHDADADQLLHVRYSISDLRLHLFVIPRSRQKHASSINYILLPCATLHPCLPGTTYYSGLNVLTLQDSHCRSQVSQILGAGLEILHRRLGRAEAESGWMLMSATGTEERGLPDGLELAI